MLDGIQARYDAEVKAMFGRLRTRGMVDRREAWSDYVAFVRKLVSREALIAERAAELDALAAGTRGGAGPWRDDKDQITGLRFADKTVLLTFDDGPSSRYTPVVLDILQQRGVPAVFFQVGRNVGKGAETRRVLAAGHALANHSFSHAFLPKLNADKLNHQLADTNQALVAAVQQAPVLFRPPYGARNDKVLEAASALGMKTDPVERRFDGLGRPGAAIDRQPRDRAGRAPEARHHPVPRHPRTDDAGAAAWCSTS